MGPPASSTMASPGRSPLAIHDPVVEEPFEGEEAHQSRLDSFILADDTEIDLITHDVDDLEKSPTTRRSSGFYNGDNGPSPFRFQQPAQIPMGSIDVPPMVVKEVVQITQAALPDENTEINPSLVNNQSLPAPRFHSTPVHLGKVRPLEIPSSLEKFKSLKIGLDSLQQSTLPTAAPSPLKPANPFSPKRFAVEEPPVVSVPAADYSDVRKIVNEALADFKATVRNDIQSLHIEIIKQSIAQQNWVRDLLDEYLPAVKELMEELRQVRYENEILKLRLQGELDQVDVRRSTRSKKANASAISMNDPMSDDIVAPDTQQQNETVVSAADGGEESPFHLTVSPSKNSNEPLQKRPQVTGTPSVSGKGLWEQLCAKGAAHSLAVDEWLQTFAANETSSVLQLINTIFWAGSIRSDLSLAQFESDEEASEILSAFQDAIDPSELGAHVLVGRKRANQSIQRSYTDFWTKWAQSVFANLPDASDRLGRQFVPWLALLSTSRFRPLRQAASFAAFAVLVGLAKASSDLSGQLEKAARLAKSKTAGLVDTLTAQLAGVERSLQQLFTAVFIQRFRDVDRDIRKAALERLGVLVLAQTGLFLDNQYIRYLGWGLSDRAPEVRLAALESLGPLYRDRAHHAPLSAFTERFKPRLMEMALKDADDDVKRSAQSLISRLFQWDQVALEELQWVDQLLLQGSALGREGSALVLARCLGGTKASDDESLRAELVQYTQTLTNGLSSKKALHVIDHLVASLSASIEWLQDPLQAIELLPWTLIEASIRSAKGSSGNTKLATAFMEALGRLDPEGIDGISFLAIFESIQLLDPRSVSVDRLGIVLGSIQTADSDVLTAAVRSLALLRNQASLAPTVDALIDGVVADALSLLSKGDESSAPTILKAAHLMAAKRIAEWDLDQALSLLAATDATESPALHSALLQLLYQELLWRLTEERVADMPHYEALIPLRDDIMSAVRAQSTETGNRIALDILYLFSPARGQWMSETWRFPLETRLTGLKELSLDDKTIVGMARLATAGYDCAHEVLELLFSAHGSEGMDNRLLAEAIEYVRPSIPLSALLRAVPALANNASANDQLAKSIATSAKKSNALEEAAEAVMALHVEFINILEGLSKDNIEQMNAIATLASHFTALLPPSPTTPLPLDHLRQALLRVRKAVTVNAYLKVLEKHAIKANFISHGGTGKLQLTPQKRRGPTTTGGSRLKESVDVMEEPVDDDDADSGAEDDFSANGSDSEDSIPPTSEGTIEANNAFRQMALENEEDPMPLFKKRTLRS